MSIRLDPSILANQYPSKRLQSGSRGTVRRMIPPRALAILAWLAWLMIGTVVGPTASQEIESLPGFESGAMDASCPPESQVGGGDFFSQDLGTMLRIRYNTQSYGQDEHGNLDIGTFQAINFDDSLTFFDGQVTLNDVQGVGFNLGVGYRWMNFPSYATASERINGVSLWADGTSTKEGNFFPQVGVSYESLGDLWDFRANGYIPVGDERQVGDFRPTGEIGFKGFFLSQLTEAVVDTSFNVAEVEVARRLGQERDAWAFAGPYFLANDDQDSVGYEIGLRGYAYPDLLLQFAVTDDEIFATNATFSLVWFVGRTRTHFQPTCGVPDRFREPVLRNDYVALAQDRATGGIPLTDPDGNEIRVVHVSSSAPDGGTGTFENPLNNLGNVNANSQAGDIILAHATSVFDSQAAAELKNNQRFLGEGNNFVHEVNTAEEGVIDLPETSPGARGLARPMIVDALGDAITLADNNEVADFDINGGVRAIVAGTSGAGDPDLHDLAISDTTGDAIALTPFIRTDTTDEDNDGNTTEQTIAFNVAIDKVTFDTIGGDDIDLNADTGGVDPTDPNVTLDEDIRITEVTSTNGNGSGARIRNTHDGGTIIINDYQNTNGSASKLSLEDVASDITITNAEIMGGSGFALDFLDVADESAVVVDDLTYDGGTGAAGGISMDNFDGTFTIRNSKLENGTQEGVAILNDSDGAFSFQSTVEMTSIDGTAFLVDGGADEFNGTVTVAHEITNDTGRSVVVRNLSGGTTTPSVTFTNSITDSGQGILVDSNAGGTVRFSGTLDMDTTGNPAVTVSNNTGTNINFSGAVDIATTTGAGFTATGGGTLTASSTVNSVSTTTGRAVQITDMTIAAAGVHFGNVNRTVAAATSAIQLENNTGGPITIGNTTDLVGDAGTIEGAAGGAIRIVDSANVSVTGLNVNNTSAAAAVHIEKTNSAAMTTNLSDLAITGGTVGVDTVGGGTGAITMTINDTTVNNPTAEGLQFTGLNAGTVSVNNATVNGGSLALELSGTNSGSLNLKVVDSTLNNNVAISLSGAGHFGLLVDNTDINTGNNDVAFSLTQSGGATNADLTFRNGNNFTTGGAQALLIDSAGASGKTVNLLVENSTFLNNSAASATADITAEQTSLMNATIQGNTFMNSNAGDNFNITSNGGAAFMQLNLGGTGADRNTAAGGTATYQLHEDAGSDFDVFEMADTFGNLRNTGTVNGNGGTYDNLLVAPPLPVVP